MYYLNKIFIKIQEIFLFKVNFMRIQECTVLLDIATQTNILPEE